ncbi:MAG: chromosomal replication initiator protein DnaA [bacterium]
MSLEELWKITLAQIEVKLDSPAHFKTWFKDTILLEISGNSARIGVKNSYTSDWLNKRHNKLIAKSISYVYGSQLSPVFEIDKSLANIPNPKITADDIIKDTPIFAMEFNDETIFQKLRKSNINSNYSFDAFIVGPSNKLAHAASLGVARNPGQSYNPLFIYGGTGLGKTHLSQAIGRYILEKDQTKNILYISSEGFLNDMVKAIKSGKTTEFRQKYRTLDLLIIDDIQFLSKWQETQNEFFNTFNVLYNDKKQIILISDRPPEQIERIEERLRSRFQGGMIADIIRPEFEMRLAILEKKAQEMQMDLTKNMLEQIANLITDNVRELEGALQKIHLYNSMHESHLSNEEISSILGKDVRSRREKVKPNQIIRKVAKEFDLTVKELHGPRRTQEIAFARQICMYILREDFGYKLEDVAKYLNRKDHTTVLHAVDKIKSMIARDEGFKNQLELILENITKEES